MPDADSPKPGSRALLTATIAYGLLGTVALVAFGTLPAATETGAEVITWFRSSPNSVRLGVWAFTVALPPFAAMVALLRGMLPAPHRDVFLFGAAVYAASIAVWTWTWGGLALHTGTLDPAIARTVLDVALFFWTCADRRDNDDDGPRYVARPQGRHASPLAGRARTCRLRRAEHRNDHDLRFHWLHPAGRCDEHATRRRAHLSLDPGVRALGRPARAILVLSQSG